MRSRMNALVSQPLVGMIDGVAARRARFLDSESYASFSDRTRMLARRASASTSARAASACWPPGPSALRLSRSDHMPADPRLLHGRVGRREPGEQTQLLLPLTETLQRVPQPRHALAHPLDLVREQAVLVLERAAMRDVHAARNGGDAQHQEGQCHHAADADERFDEGL